MCNPITSTRYNKFYREKTTKINSQTISQVEIKNVHKFTSLFIADDASSLARRKYIIYYKTNVLW